MFKSLLLMAFVTLLMPIQSMAQEKQEKSMATRDDTAMDRPNALSVELLGRAGLYSFDYDYSLTDEIAVGGGFSYLSASASNNSAIASVSILVIPLYMNYYFQPGPNRGFVTGGLDIVSASATFAGTDGFTASGSGVGAVLGGGYEYRGTSGFLFRAAPYFIFGSGGGDLWFGLTFGFTF